MEESNKHVESKGIFLAVKNCFQDNSNIESWQGLINEMTHHLDGMTFVVWRDSLKQLILL